MNTLEKIILSIGVIIFLCVIAYQHAIAGGYHHHHQEIQSNQSQLPITTLTGQSEGVASAIAAAQHQFNYGVLTLQGSVAFGQFNDETALSFGLAQRFRISEKNSILVNGSFSKSNGDKAIGAAANWTF